MHCRPASAGHDVTELSEDVERLAILGLSKRQQSGLQRHHHQP